MSKEEQYYFSDIVTSEEYAKHLGTLHSVVLAHISGLGKDVTEEAAFKLKKTSSGYEFSPILIYLTAADLSPLIDGMEGFTDVPVALANATMEYMGRNSKKLKEIAGNPHEYGVITSVKSQEILDKETEDFKNFLNGK